jgi:hypothetical protein
MEKFGLSGLWSHVGSTLVAALFPVADALLGYLNVIALPTWAHALVGVAALLLATYRGKRAAPQLAP